MKLYDTIAQLLDVLIWTKGCNKETEKDYGMFVGLVYVLESSGEIDVEKCTQLYHAYYTATPCSFHIASNILK